MKKVIFLIVVSVMISGCDFQEQEIKACTIDSIDTQEDVGVVLILPNPIESREELVVCEAWVNAYLEEKYDSNIPGRVVFSTCTDEECKSISSTGLTR